MLPLDVIETLVFYLMPDFIEILISCLTPDVVEALVSLLVSDIIKILISLLTALAASVLMPKVLKIIRRSIMLIVKGSGATNIEVNKDDIWKLLKILKEKKALKRR